MSERQSDSMRFKQELDEHITKSDDVAGHLPASEDPRELAENWLNEHKHVWSAHDLFSLTGLLQKQREQTERNMAVKIAEVVEELAKDLRALAQGAKP